MDEPRWDPDEGSIQPRTVGQILGAALDLYRRHWPILVAIVAVVAVPLTLLEYYVSDELIGRSVTVDDRGVVSEDLWRPFAGLAVVSIIGFLITQVAAGAITRGVAKSLTGEAPSLDASYRYGAARLGSILLVSVLTGLAVLAGFILLVIPGIFVLVRLSVATAALVVEDRRGREALSRSWNLVRGRGWPVFGTLLLTGLILGALVSLLLLPFTDSSWFVRSLAATVASVITQPFSTLVIVLIYVDLRVRNEGLTAATLGAELRASEPPS